MSLNKSEKDNNELKSSLLVKSNVENNKNKNEPEIDEYKDSKLRKSINCNKTPSINSRGLNYEITNEIANSNLKTNETEMQKNKSIKSNKSKKTKSLKLQKTYTDFVRRFVYRFTILIDLIGWSIIVAPMSALVGVCCAIFLLGIDFVTNTRFSYPWLLFLLPISGILQSIIYKSTLGSKISGGLI